MRLQMFLNQREPKLVEAVAGRHARTPRKTRVCSPMWQSKRRIHEPRKRVHARSTLFVKRNCRAGYRVMWMETRRCAHARLYEREITREPRLLVNAMHRADTPFSPPAATYIWINRRKDGRGRCILLRPPNDRGNENTSSERARENMVLRCNVRNPGERSPPARVSPVCVSLATDHFMPVPRPVTQQPAKILHR